MSTSSAPAVPSGIPSGNNALAARGKRRIEWSFQSMPVLQFVRKQFIKTQPFARMRLAACLNITPETANLLITLRDGGANLAVGAAQPLSAEDDIAASLLKDYGLRIHPGVREVIAEPPHLVLDHAAEVSKVLHAAEPIPAILGATEQTASGANKLRRLARNGALAYPVIALDDSQTKQLVENRYGTGQSILEAILRATNVLIAGMNVVVLGYGNCGSGVALRAKGLGANVMVCEVDPLRALTAVLEGYRVLSISEAASLGDLFVASTGGKNIIGREHFEKFKTGAVLCNAGNSAVEFDLETLAHISSSHRTGRDYVEEFVLRDGRRIYLLAGGQTISSIPAGAPSASVLDISCANQALSAEYLVKSVPAFDKTKGVSSLEKIVHPVPAGMDRQIAKIKLESMGIQIDRLTMEQEQYLAAWSDGA